MVADRTKMESMRLNKFLSDAGVCSRRQADKLIEEGKIHVNSKNAIMGMQITPKDEVIYNGKQISLEEKLILIALNKPEGIECTADRKNPDNIVDFVGLKDRVYPVGRLDKNSCGLIFLTNDGMLVNKIMRAANHHEKEYIVRVNKAVTDRFIQGMSNGVPILNTVTRKCIVKKVDQYTFTIILTQGLNRQIRRMCEFFGYKVTKLKRVRIMNIKLGNLKEGTYRNVTDDELKYLLKLTQKSRN